MLAATVAVLIASTPAVPAVVAVDPGEDGDAGEAARGSGEGLGTFEPAVRGRRARVDGTVLLAASALPAAHVAWAWLDTDAYVDFMLPDDDPGPLIDSTPLVTPTITWLLAAAGGHRLILLRAIVRGLGRAGVGAPARLRARPRPRRGGPGVAPGGEGSRGQRDDPGLTRGVAVPTVHPSHRTGGSIRWTRSS